MRVRARTRDDIAKSCVGCVHGQAFLYLLGSLAFRQNLQKFLGSAPPPEVQAAMAELFAPRPS